MEERGEERFLVSRHTELSLERVFKFFLGAGGSELLLGILTLGFLFPLNEHLARLTFFGDS
jgi:hypothetical protein